MVFRAATLCCRDSEFRASDRLEGSTILVFAQERGSNRARPIEKQIVAAATEEGVAPTKKLKTKRTRAKTITYKTTGNPSTRQKIVA